MIRWASLCGGRLPYSAFDAFLVATFSIQNATKWGLWGGLLAIVLLTLAQQARGYLRIQMFMKLVLKHEIDLWYNVNG